MNFDSRGIKRGACNTEDCDCELYEYDKKNGPKCNYCCCPPTKHQKLDIKEENVEENSPILNISLESNIGPESGYTIQNLIPVSVVYDPVATPSCSSQSDFEELLPKKLPKAIEEALKKKSLTPSMRNKIVRVIADKSYEAGVSTKDIHTVADLATQKWSSLKAGFGESSAALATQIKRRICKLRLSQKNDSQANAEEEENHSLSQHLMKLEMVKASPSLLKLKQFLDASRPKRKEIVNNTAALQVLVEYPALKISDLLLWEFTQIVDINECEMNMRWKKFLLSMREYLLRTKKVTSLSETYEVLTLQILTKLPSILPSGKRTGDATKHILQVYNENTALNKIAPARTDPPRLVAIGEEVDNISLFCYVDGVAIFSVNCPIKAVLLLLATYWVFNIQFAGEARPSFQLISSAILKEKIVEKPGFKCTGAVDCLLKQLSL